MYAHLERRVEFKCTDICSRFPGLGNRQDISRLTSEKAILVVWIYFKVSFNSGFQDLFLSHLSATTKLLLQQDFLNISVLTFATTA